MRVTGLDVLLPNDLQTRYFPRVNRADRPVYVNPDVEPGYGTRLRVHCSSGLPRPKELEPWKPPARFASRFQTRS